MPWFFGRGRGYPYWWRIDWAGKWGRPRSAARCPQCGLKMIAGITQYECPGCGHVVPKPTSHLEHYHSPPDSTTERVKDSLYSKLGRVPGGGHFASFELPRQMSTERWAVRLLAFLPAILMYIDWDYPPWGLALPLDALHVPGIAAACLYLAWFLLYLFTASSSFITLRQVMAPLSVVVAAGTGAAAFRLWTLYPLSPTSNWNHPWELQLALTDRVSSPAVGRIVLLARSEAHRRLERDRAGSGEARLDYGDMQRPGAAQATACTRRGCPTRLSAR